MGWAIDPDSAAPVTMHVYVDGAWNRALTAGTTRPELAATWPGYGIAHGYATMLSLPAGSHQVCLWALNATGGPGGNVRVGCSTLTVRHTPLGVMSRTELRPDGLVVGGWALDPDSAGGVTVRLKVDGRQVALTGATLSNLALATRFPGYGARHAWLTLLHLGRGRHVVCATADNVTGTPGGSGGLGCRTITVL